MIVLKFLSENFAEKVRRAKSKLRISKNFNVSFKSGSRLGEIASRVVAKMFGNGEMNDVEGGLGASKAADSRGVVYKAECLMCKKRGGK